MADKWIKIITQIKQDKTSGSVAPYKPLLILWLIGNYLKNGERQVPFNKIEKPLEKLMSDFRIGKAQPTADRPFVHLANEARLWKVETKNGEDIYQMDKNTRRSKIFLRKEAIGELSQLFVDEVINSNQDLEQIINSILHENFPETTHRDILESVELLGTVRLKTRSRDPKFASTIRRAYEDSCAFCGYNGRLDGRLVGIEAAHIRMHSQGGIDDIANGIALCVLHHKLFDSGVISLDESYKILISQDFRVDEGTNVMPTMSLSGKEIRHPQRGYDLPSHDNIIWHREHIFRGPERN